LKTSVYESKIPIVYDNRATISISKKPTFHSRSKHIKIKNHFIRDHVLNGTMGLQSVPNDEQLANIFTKLLTKERLILLRIKLGMTFVND